MKLFVFDIDGTLLNTVSDIGGACNVMLERHGFPAHPLPDYKKMVGNGFKKLVMRSLPQDRQFEANELAALVKEAMDWYETHMMEKTEPYEGIPQALAALKAAGAQLAVLSNKPDVMCAPLVRHYFPEIAFLDVRGQRPDTPLKPDPTALLEIMKEAGVDKSQCAYAGDSDVDMILARNAGVAGLGASWGFRGVAELEAAGPTRILWKPADLLEYI